MVPVATGAITEVRRHASRAAGLDRWTSTTTPVRPTTRPKTKATTARPNRDQPARRAGWSLLGLAVIAFVFGLVVGLTGVVVVLVVGALALGSAFLLPAIIVGFGVSAAEREDPGDEGRPMEPWA